MKSGFMLVEIMLAIFGIGVIFVLVFAIIDRPTPSEVKGSVKMEWVSAVGYVRTIEYDNHKFISFGGTQVLHHPDCQCVKK